jgi:cytochrome c oxidase subunit 4
MSMHVSPVRNYVRVFLSLLVLTFITVFVAFQDLGSLNTLVALGIAITKATIVILFFMHAKYSTRLTKLVIVSAFVWLLFLFGFTMSDFMTRGMMGVLGK